MPPRKTKAAAQAKAAETATEATHEPEAAQPAAKAPQQPEAVQTATEATQEPEATQPAAEAPQEQEAAQSATEAPKEPEAAQTATQPPQQPEADQSSYAAPEIHSKPLPGLFMGEAQGEVRLSVAEFRMGPLMDGAKLRRASWKAEASLMLDQRPKRGGVFPEIVMSGKRGGLVPYKPSIEDLLAKDWEALYPVEAFEQFMAS